MKQLEQAVADTFNSYMCDRLRTAGKAYSAFSLGGQDRDTADYLISNAKGFALIEFKHSELELVSERKKQKRERLCMLLQSNKRMREIHDKCHFVTWSDSKTGAVLCAPYRTEICNHHVFPNCDALTRQRPLKNRRINAETYCTEFISPPPERYAEKEEFEEYLAWLMRDASGSGKETVELLATSSIGCATIRLDSVDAAWQWMQSQYGFRPKPKKARS